MFSVLTGQTTDLTWPDSDASSISEMVSRYGDTCHGHGGSDVFPFGLLDTDTDGFEVGEEPSSPKRAAQALTLVAVSVLVSTLPIILFLVGYPIARGSALGFPVLASTLA